MNEQVAFVDESIRAALNPLEMRIAEVEQRVTKLEPTKVRLSVSVNGSADPKAIAAAMVEHMKAVKVAIY